MDGELILFGDDGDFPEEISTALTAESDPAGAAGKKAAFEYLLSLPSAESRKTMFANLKTAVSQLGMIIESFDWRVLREPLVTGIVAKMSAASYSPYTIGTALAALKGVAKRLWMNGDLTTREYEMIRGVRCPRGSRLQKGRALKPSELHVLFKSAKEEDSLRAHRDAAIMGLMSECGLRRAEISGLKYEWICMDPENPSLNIIGKGNKERICMIPDGALALLTLWLEDRGDRPGPCFLRINKYGEVVQEGLTPQRIYSITQDWAKKLGMEKWTPHDLRRTYASSLLDLGVDINTVREMMGHTNIQTTQRYDRRSRRRMREAADRLKLTA